MLYLWSGYYKDKERKIAPSSCDSLRENKTEISEY